MNPRLNSRSFLDDGVSSTIATFTLPGVRVRLAFTSSYISIRPSAVFSRGSSATYCRSTSIFSYFGTAIIVFFFSSTSGLISFRSSTSTPSLRAMPSHDSLDFALYVPKLSSFSASTVSVLIRCTFALAIMRIVEPALKFFSLTPGFSLNMSSTAQLNFFATL